MKVSKIPLNWRVESSRKPNLGSFSVDKLEETKKFQMLHFGAFYRVARQFLRLEEGSAELQEAGRERNAASVEGPRQWRHSQIRSRSR